MRTLGGTAGARAADRGADRWSRRAGRQGRCRGYATPAERHSQGDPAVRRSGHGCRGWSGGWTRAAWRWCGAGGACCASAANLGRRRADSERSGGREWETARLFLTADGERGKLPGATTPSRGTPMSGGWRSTSPPLWRTWPTGPGVGTGCLAPSRFPPRRPGRRPGRHRGHPLRHELRPGQGPLVRGRVSWRIAAGPGAALQELRRHPVVAVDVNAGHLAAVVIAPDGNVLGTPATIGLDLAGLPADGPRRAAARGDQRPDRQGQAARRAGDRDRGPGFRPGPRRGTRDARQQALARQARPGVSAGWSQASPPGGCGTGWPRWPPTRACPS